MRCYCCGELLKPGGVLPPPPNDSILTNRLHKKYCKNGLLDSGPAGSGPVGSGRGSSGGCGPVGADSGGGTRACPSGGDSVCGATPSQSWANIVAAEESTHTPNYGGLPVPIPRHLPRPNTIVLHMQAFRDITVREVMDALLQNTSLDTIKSLQQIPGPATA